MRRDLLAVGTLAEESLTKAVKAILERRVDLAEEVLAGDRQIDEREVEVENECLKLLALHQPVAADLRFIVALLKVNNDLERIGDLAVNLAEHAHALAGLPPLPLELPFVPMGRATLAMLRSALDALIKSDVEGARDVIGRDDEVDALYRSIFDEIQPLMMKDPDTVVRAVHTMQSARDLERAADLATNIAEDVVFMVTGDLVRHRPERFD
jgi:phosphate transport system protein